jgi:hypothetical protein
MIRLISLAFVAITIVSGCTPRLSPFTQELYERSDWDEKHLKQIQFYLSEDIVLTRQVTKGESEIFEGKIKIVNGKRVEEIIIREGTPGVYLFSPKANRFAVSFEEGKDDLYLMFGPNPKFGNRYALLAKEWDRTSGKVRYHGKLYNVRASSAFASLMVDLRRLGETEYNSRSASGRTVK